ncbi:DUF1622 domain-containing protein [Tabrizicola sp. J26]|uniref:DUF1622 domain-containing protein n=1 Tax=Alitabrizicola rongguiensis TaxID=2909234 RepID=UPI001F16E1D9|nr:DUF1622 domain-containing protein [Tabrizicola rongguiensis]MCF1709553.1 DUF1622 domain-containing protein [Tabrizicola rongguiensis]
MADLGSLIPAGKESLLNTRFPGLVEVLTWVEAGIDLFAILVMLAGVLRFAAAFLGAERRRNGRIAALDTARMELGRYILAGLELMIVSDIIETALSLQLSDLVFLGLLVLIRSVISYFLDREMGEISRHGDGPGA